MAGRALIAPHHGSFRATGQVNSAENVAVISGRYRARSRMGANGRLKLEKTPVAGRSWKTWKMNGEEKGRACAALSVQRAADHIAQKLARWIATSS